MIINFETAFPIEWETEYYTVEKETKDTRYCKCCDNTGKVTIKGKSYTCPECNNRWAEKEVIGTHNTYSVGKWCVSSAIKNRFYMSISFVPVNAKNNSTNVFTIDNYLFGSMTDRNGKKLYNDYKEAMQEVKRLNAAEKARQKEQEESQC